MNNLCPYHINLNKHQQLKNNKYSALFKPMVDLFKIKNSEAKQLTLNSLSQHITNTTKDLEKPNLTQEEKENLKSKLDIYQDVYNTCVFISSPNQVGF